MPENFENSAVTTGLKNISFHSNPKTCIISYIKQTTSPGSVHDTGYLGLVNWDDPEGWYGEGGGFRMGNMCIPLAGSC